MTTHYNNWIRKKRIILFWIIAGLLIAGTVLGLAWWPLYFIGVVGLPFLYIAIIITYMHWQFGPGGGDYIRKIHRLIIDNIPRQGNVLDVGCGSGQLLVSLAKRNGLGAYTGIDYWGEDWEYSRQQCEDNARAEGVGKIVFQNASASKLPFADKSFDIVVSCVTFHEVQDVADRTEPIGEALRVLRPGGTFAFFDLFDSRAYFGGRERVIQVIQKAGCTVTSQKKASELMRLPLLLKMGKALGHAVLIVGKR